jgi:L-rhamnose mutarotase
LLVGYLETQDFELARSAMTRREINARWQMEMADFFVKTGDLLPDQAIKPLEEVFHV